MRHAVVILRIQSLKIEVQVEIEASFHSQSDRKALNKHLAGFYVQIPSCISCSYLNVKIFLPVNKEYSVIEDVAYTEVCKAVRCR